MDPTRELRQGSFLKKEQHDRGEIIDFILPQFFLLNVSAFLIKEDFSASLKFPFVLHFCLTVSIELALNVMYNFDFRTKDASDSIFLSL